MNLDEKLIMDHGGEKVNYKRQEVIFRQHSIPRFYHQVASGSIRMYNISDNGKEYTQGIFGAGRSFGEPPMVINKPYPAIAEALEDTEVFKLPSDIFFNLLKKNADLNFRFLQLLANRTYRKAVINSEIITGSPEVRIFCLLNFYKEEMRSTEKILIPYTRQQIANMTGLRVETVIRTLIKLSEAGKVSIVNKKLYY